VGDPKKSESRHRLFDFFSRIRSRMPMIWHHTTRLLARRMYSSFPPHSMINMPALSPTMTMGNLGVWSKKIGDSIQPGDVLVEIETDKAQMDFECQDEGFLAQILVPSGTQEVGVNLVSRARG
jgi:hypothetical protein